VLFNHCPFSTLRGFNVELGIKTPHPSIKEDLLTLFKQEGKLYNVRNSLTDNKRLEKVIVSRKVSKWVY